MDLDYVPEAKCVLLGMILMGKTVAKITDIATQINAPLVDVDFGRTALTAEKCNKTTSYDLVNLSNSWMEKYVPEWFEATSKRKQNDTNREEDAAESSPTR